jgi:hypothetical protein
MPDRSEPPLFVETTILIWLLTMPASVQARIQQALRERVPISSTFVKAEYINTYLRAAIAVFNLIAGAETLEEAHRRWQADFRSHSKLEVHHFITVLLADEKNKDAALRRLRHVIETSVWLHFNEITKQVTNATQCQAAGVRPHWNGTNYELPLDFPPAEAPDGLRDFLTRHRALLAKIENDIASNDKHWRSVKSSIRQLRNGQFTLGKRAWERLSDVIIALEAYESQSEIYTGNVKHFGPLCEAIQLPMKPETAR